MHLSGHICLCGNQATVLQKGRVPQGRSQVLEGGMADGKTEAGGLGGTAPQKLEGYIVIAGSFVAAF